MRTCRKEWNQRSKACAVHTCLEVHDDDLKTDFEPQSFRERIWMMASSQLEDQWIRPYCKVDVQHGLDFANFTQTGNRLARGKCLAVSNIIPRIPCCGRKSTPMVLAYLGSTNTKERRDTKDDNFPGIEDSCWSRSLSLRAIRDVDVAAPQTCLKLDKNLCVCIAES